LEFSREAGEASRG